VTGGRLHVAYATDGSVTLPAPPGRWEVVVSRGYEYEIVRQTIDVTAGAATRVDAVLDHVVDTTGVQCGDFHVHTWRSNDSGDETTQKLAQAVADGVELPGALGSRVRRGLHRRDRRARGRAYAAGFASIELTSMELWGHMGVFR